MDWVSIEDDVPAMLVYVFIYSDKTNSFGEARRESFCWRIGGTDDTINFHDVTHWMPQKPPILKAN